MKYNGHSLRWHFRNGTYKELDRAVWWCGDVKAAGYVYRRQDGRVFLVWFVKDHKGKKTLVYEIPARELDSIRQNLVEIENSIFNEYRKEK